VGLLIGPGSAAHASILSSQPSAAAIARAAIKDLPIGQHANDQRMGVTRQASGLTPGTSTNWSGYADTGSNFTEVNGSWVEPSVTCSGTTTALVAFWVGLDGYTSDSVEQDGTLIECYEGTATKSMPW
jgi:hypothetical protein